MRFTHVINPFAAAGSEHGRAQQVTFASLRRAVEEAKREGIGVEVLAVTFPEDLETVEAPARGVGRLERSVQEIRRLTPVRRFPLLTDLLRIAYEEGRGEYLVYSNIDIALQPHFYVAAAEMIRQQGMRDFAATITRRTIGDQFQSPDELAAMYTAPSLPHPGCDCFIFPRRYVPELRLGNVCIGTRFFDWLLVANLDAISGFQFQKLEQEHLTFHIGDDRSWVARVNYERFNLRETLAAMRELRARYPAPPPGGIFRYAESTFADYNSLKQRVLRQLKRFTPLVRLKHRWQEAQRNRVLQTSP